MSSSEELESFRNRMYASYASDHAGIGGKTARDVFRRDIEPHLPVDQNAAIVDIGCGQGALLAELIAAGYTNATGVDVSEEQVAIARSRGLTQVQRADLHEHLAGSQQFQAVIATDLLEHMTRFELLRLLDSVFAALSPGGVFVARVPNATSPFAGIYRYGDLTHEISLTPRSVRQLSAVVGFKEVEVWPCDPIGRGWRGWLRLTAWRLASTCMRIAIAAESGHRSGVVVTQNMMIVAQKDR